MKKSKTIIKTAEEVLEEFTPHDLFGTVINMVDADADRDLSTAIDPDFKKNSARLAELFEQISNNDTLTVEQLKEAFAEYDSLVNSERLAKEEQWFFLGYVVASKLLPCSGKEVSHE